MRKNSIFFLFFFFIAMVFFPTNAADERKDTWPMYGCTSSGTRANLGETLARPPYEVVWEKEENINFVSEPIIAMDNVYIINENKELLAYKIKTGNLSWIFPHYETFWEPVYDQGRLYALTKEGTLFALDASTGEEYWTKLLDDNFIHPPLLCDRRLYLLAKKSIGIEFYVINPANGQIIWKKPIQHVHTNSFAVNEKIICFTTFDENDKSGLFNEVIALSVKDGKILWKTKINGANHPIINMGVVLVGSSNYYFYALNELTGEKIWRLKLEGNSNHYCSYYNYAIINTNTGKIYAVDILKGKMYWTATSGGNTSYIFSANGMAYFRSFYPLAGRDILSGAIFSADKAMFESVLLEKYKNYSKFASIGLNHLVAVGKNTLAVFKAAGGSIK